MERIGNKARVRTLRPLHDQRAVQARFIQAQLFQCPRIVQPIEIDMRDGQAHRGRVIRVHQRVAGAGHFALVPEPLQDTACKNRLARPQIETLATNIEQIGGVAAIQNRKLFVQTQRAGLFALFWEHRRI